MRNFSERKECEIPQENLIDARKEDTRKEDARKEDGAGRSRNKCRENYNTVK
jgi:hypothetical protein